MTYQAEKKTSPRGRQTLPRHEWLCGSVHGCKRQQTKHCLHDMSTFRKADYIRKGLPNGTLDPWVGHKTA